VRVLGVVVLVAVVLGAWRVVDADAFPVQRVSVEGAVLTDRGAVETALLSGAGSVFRYDSAAAAARVAALPTVLHASVHVGLPDLVTASVTERTAVLLWSREGDAGGDLVDADGLVFAHVATPPAGLPRVEDRRTGAAAVSIGDHVPAVDLRVARTLASITPTMLGTAAPALGVAITDADGFEIVTRPASWTAVFGPYGEVTRSPDIVPLQVQCLASLLAAGPEERIGRVVLSPEGQACGTYSPPTSS
jgi:cell division protein FtsQ